MADNPRLEWHLENWSRYQRTGAKVKTFPKRVAVLSGAGPQFDDLCDSADLTAAKTMDALILDLEPAEQCAIHHEYLEAVWRFRDGVYAETLDQAKWKLIIGMNRRGLA